MTPDVLFLVPVCVPIVEGIHGKGHAEILVFSVNVFEIRRFKRGLLQGFGGALKHCELTFSFESDRRQEAWGGSDVHYVMPSLTKSGRRI